MRKKQFKYLQIIKDIFGEYELEEYEEDLKYKRLSFLLRRTEFNAEKLFKLSDFLETRVIKIDTETRNDGYCDTCSYEYGVMRLTIENVNFD